MNFKEFEELIHAKKYSEIKKIYSEMEEYDISVLLSDLSEEELKQAFRLLPKDIAADVFTNFDNDLQVELIKALSTLETKELVEDMYTDDAADLFEEMPSGVVSKILAKVDKETRDEINALLKYPKNSAGSLMAVEYVDLKKGLTIKESIDRIRKQAEDVVAIDNCFVVDKKRKLHGNYIRVECLGY